jgi:hypothetical protein
MESMLLKKTKNEQLKMRYILISEYVHIGLGFVGMWFFYAQICVLARVSFITLRNFSFLPFLAFSLLLFFFNKSNLPKITSSCEGGIINKVPALLWWGVGAPLVVTIIFWITGSEWLFWFMAIVYIFVISFFLSPSLKPIDCDYDPQISFIELAALTAVCLLAVLITLGAHRPNADDAYFVNVAVSAIDFPKQSILAFDGMHKSGLPPVEQTLHLLQVYELFVAVLSDITTIPVHTMYYVIFPALWTFFAIVVHWLVLRNFLSSTSAMFGLVIVIVILISWGDGHRTYGNFAFVRLYQGKAIYLLVALPLIIHAALQYRFNANSRNWLYLMLCQCAALGFTTTGLIVAPMAAGLVLLVRPQITGSFWRISSSGLATSLPLFLLAIGMYVRLIPYRMSLETGLVLLGYEFVLGSQRTNLVLLCLLLLPALAYMVRIRYADWIVNYILIIFLLLFCPATASFFATSIGHVFSWRIFWAFPIPLFLGLTMGIMVSNRIPYRWFWVILSGCWLVMFSLMGPHAVSQRNWAWSYIGGFKVAENPFDVAQRIMEIASKDSLALVPGPVAVYLCGFHKAPPLVGVRSLYLAKLRGVLPDEELNDRINLFQYIGGKHRALSVKEVLQAIDEQNIKTVVFPENHLHAQLLIDFFNISAFKITRHAKYVIAVKIN